VNGALATVWLLAIAAAAAAEPAAAARQVREVRFSGESAVDQLCGSLLDARRTAELQGRLDFTAEVAFTGSSGLTEVTARISPGSAYAVGRITFAGHTALNDSTLRRAMVLYERDLFDVVRLRRSLARINDTGFFERLTLADVTVERRSDGVTADVTIPLRERRRRWWSLSGPLIPGIGSFRASIASRLPPWGRGVLDASTYVVTFNLLGIVGPLAKVLPLALERPLLPGQELSSGFALSSSPRAMLAHYARSQLARGVHAILGAGPADPLAVPVTPDGQHQVDGIVCHPPKSRLWWLRRGGAIAADLLLSGS
jgi:outer membrane protein insertion porin family